MPRPLIKKDTATVLPIGQARTASRTSSTRIHTGPRSQRYLAALARLDVSGNLGQVEIEKLIDDIHREFADKYCALPIGIVSKCYLGDPFEVHTLATDRSIIEHYRSGQPLPGPLEGARGLAATAAYLAIEVYPNRMVCVREDGSTILTEAVS